MQATEANNHTNIARSFFANIGGITPKHTGYGSIMVTTRPLPGRDQS